MDATLPVGKTTVVLKCSIIRAPEIDAIVGIKGAVVRYKENVV